MKKSFMDSEILQRVAQSKHDGLYPYFRAIQSCNGPELTIDGQALINIGSNNYLGLTQHPEVMEAASRAIRKYGTGCTGSRFLNGNLDLHEALEQGFAEFLQQPAALVFSTGMQANLGALSSLCGPRDCLLMDAENHASLLDASRLAFGRVYKFRHADMEGLEGLLETNRDRFERIYIVTDGVFSISGEIAELPQLVDLARRYHAFLYVDDAHGLGVLGEQGRGTPDHFGLASQVDFHMGTFSKSLAAIGGVVCGSQANIDYIRHTARSFIFSAAIPPPVAATVLACLDILKRDNELHARLWENVAFMRHGLRELGLLHGEPHSPILPIFIGEDDKALRITRFLMEQGVFATPILAPAVAPGEAMIRTSYMATHARPHLERVLEVLQLADRRFGIARRLAELEE